MTIKWKNAFVCYFFGNAISFVKNNFSNFFYKIRAKQAQGADKL